MQKPFWNLNGLIADVNFSYQTRETSYRLKLTIKLIINS